jgi:hypothetical protein
MPIPKRESGELENDFIPRCISAISGEYEQDQAVAICYQQLDVSLIRDKQYRNGLTKANAVLEEFKKGMKKKSLQK